MRTIAEEMAMIALTSMTLLPFPSRHVTSRSDRHAPTHQRWAEPVRAGGVGRAWSEQQRGERSVSLRSAVLNPRPSLSVLGEAGRMQQLTYASKSIFTTDAVTDALLELVTAIDREEHSEVVTVPAFTDEGHLVEAKMTLDASSELVAVPVELDVEDEDATTDAVTRAVRDIRSRIRSNRPVVSSSAGEDEPDPFTYDEY
jgi:hypothetical protein